MQNKGTWGVYRWFSEDGKDKIHKDDFEKFQENISNVSVVERVNTANGFLIIKYNNCTYRVKGSLSLELAEPRLKFGDAVIHRNNENEDVEGIVVDVMWHYGRKSNYYFISVDGKKKSARYFDEDLKKV